MDHACAHFHHMQRQFNNRVTTLTTIKFAETASAAQRVAVHVIESVEPSVQRTEDVTVKTYRTAKHIDERGRRMDMQMQEVCSNIKSYEEVLLNVRALLCDLLSNNECKSQQPPPESSSSPHA